MSDSCPTCGQWVFEDVTKPHRCPPRWEARVKDEDPRLIFAGSAEEAAEKFTEDYEDGYCDYSIAAGGTLEVLVRSAPVYVDPAAPVAPELTYTVFGECVRAYHASLKEEQHAEAQKAPKESSEEAAKKESGV